jgi:hypothetical protein
MRVADRTAVRNISKENIARESRLHTDESRLYFGIGRHLPHEGSCGAVTGDLWRRYLQAARHPKGRRER